MILRRFYCVLAVGPILSALGCSGPVPAAPAAGLRLLVRSSGSCSLMPGAPATTVGHPPPDSTLATGAGTRSYSGDEGLTISCGVRDNGGSNFAIYGSIGRVNESFRIDGGVTGLTGQAH